MKSQLHLIEFMKALRKIFFINYVLVFNFLIEGLLVESNSEMVKFSVFGLGNIVNKQIIWLLARCKCCFQEFASYGGGLACAVSPTTYSDFY